MNVAFDDLNKNKVYVVMTEMVSIGGASFVQLLSSTIGCKVLSTWVSRTKNILKSTFTGKVI